MFCIFELGALEIIWNNGSLLTGPAHWNSTDPNEQYPLSRLSIRRVHHASAWLSSDPFTCRPALGSDRCRPTCVMSSLSPRCCKAKAKSSFPSSRLPSLPRAPVALLFGRHCASRLGLRHHATSSRVLPSSCAKGRHRANRPQADGATELLRSPRCRFFCRRAPSCRRSTPSTLRSNRRLRELHPCFMYLTNPSAGANDLRSALPSLVPTA
jgi:hypothetical protein